MVTALPSVLTQLHHVSSATANNLQEWPGSILLPLLQNHVALWDAGSTPENSKGLQNF